MAQQVKREYADFYKFTPSGLVTYLQLLEDSDHPSRRNYWSNLEKDAKATYHGEMTRHAQIRMRKALFLLLEIADTKIAINPSTNKPFKFRLNFITLTLSSSQQDRTDSEIKKTMLEPFLRKMRAKGMNSYVWKAERQKNGNVHFHIISDTWILYTELRDIWNNLQEKAGLMEPFRAKWGHSDPNSTDVKAVRSENEAVRYLMKYMLKNDEQSQQLRLDKDYSDKAKGKMWDCSLNLKIPNQTADFLTNSQYAAIQAQVTAKKVEQLDRDYFKFFTYPRHKRRSIFPPEMMADYEAYLTKVKTFTRPQEAKPKTA